MRLRRSESALLNPTLIGAATVLAVMVAVFLAYNANSGLPFVPTFHVNMLAPDAAELIKGNEVQIAGTHVGIVTSVTPVDHQGHAYANIALQLEKRVEPLPVDTSAQIRLRSNLGLKFVELYPGRSHTAIADGGSLNPALVAPVVDLDDLLNTFGARTRAALKGVINNNGNGFAGRGSDFNDGLASLPALTRNLTSVGHVLAAPQTRLAGFVQGLASAAEAVAPVSGQLADLVGVGASTLAAIKPNDLAATINQAAVTEQAALPTLSPTRALLNAGTNFLRSAEPGLRLLPSAAPPLTRTLRIAGPVLARARTLATGITGVVDSLRRVAQLPDTTDALTQLTDTLRSTIPTLTYVNPMQTQCNYLGLWTRNIDSTISQGDTLGTWFRFTLIENPLEDLPSQGPSPTLHDIPQPDAGQNGSCEQGNQVYAPGQWIGPSPGVKPNHTEQTIPGTLAQRVAANGGNP
jgi:ABC-type transporter Mla subunit MlaD